MARRIVASPEVDEWRDRNPLKVWLTKKPRKGKIEQLMAATGCTSRQAIYAWCKGVALPRPERMQQMQALTKIKVESWLKWWAVRPKEAFACDDESSPSSSALTSGT